MSEENKLPEREVSISSSLLGQWMPIDTAPIRVTVIVGDAENTGSGWQDRLGRWFVYGSTIPMLTPTHWMEFPSPPNAKLSGDAGANFNETK